MRLNLGVKVEYRQSIRLLYPLSLSLTILAKSKLLVYPFKALFSLPLDIQWVIFSSEFSSGEGGPRLHRLWTSSHRTGKGLLRAPK